MSLIIKMSDSNTEFLTKYLDWIPSISLIAKQSLIVIGSSSKFSIRERTAGVFNSTSRSLYLFGSKYSYISPNLKRGKISLKNPDEVYI